MDDDAIMRPPPAENNNGPFLVLSPELLLLVFQYIDPNDMKTHIRAATCGDEALARFIYTECTHLWKHLDLAKFPGITDDQLHSLLERSNARSVTQSILFDKETSSALSGQGLEPLRHSRMLESIDLRQQPATIHPGPTGLDDQLVTAILSTMLPHKLQVVKVRKQAFSADYHPSQEYCFLWSIFFGNLNLFKAQACFGKQCSQCNSTMKPNSHDSSLELAQTRSVQCTACKQYSCRAWNPLSSGCPWVRECRCCLEWCCPCRFVSPPCGICLKRTCAECDDNQMTCQECRVRSCSACDRVRRCNECSDTLCQDCGQIYTCDRCQKSFCDHCKDTEFCGLCGDLVCEECGVGWCSLCPNAACQDCQQKDQRGRTQRLEVTRCQVCDSSLCSECIIEPDCQKCSYCGLWSCCEEPFPDGSHQCQPPGRAVYGARDARDDDDKNELCDCGKKHLSSFKGQTFLCSWIQK